MPFSKFRMLANTKCPPPKNSTDLSPLLWRWLDCFSRLGRHCWQLGPQTRIRCREWGLGCHRRWWWRQKSKDYGVRFTLEWLKLLILLSPLCSPNWPAWVCTVWRSTGPRCPTQGRTTRAAQMWAWPRISSHSRVTGGVLKNDGIHFKILWDQS